MAEESKEKKEKKVATKKTTKSTTKATTKTAKPKKTDKVKEDKKVEKEVKKPTEAVKEEKQTKKEEVKKNSNVDTTEEKAPRKCIIRRVLGSRKRRILILVGLILIIVAGVLYYKLHHKNEDIKNFAAEYFEMEKENKIKAMEKYTTFGTFQKISKERNKYRKVQILSVTDVERKGDVEKFTIKYVEENTDLKEVRKKVTEEVKKQKIDLDDINQVENIIKIYAKVNAEHKDKLVKTNKTVKGTKNLKTGEIKLEVDLKELFDVK